MIGLVFLSLRAVHENSSSREEDTLCLGTGRLGREGSVGTCVGTNLSGTAVTVGNSGKYEALFWVGIIKDYIL